MKIENGNNVNIGSQKRMMQDTDTTTRSIQNQIQRKQQELQKLAENKDMDMEQKMERRKEIQQEIADLERQLRQYQMEKRMEQQKEISSVENKPSERSNVHTKPQEQEIASFSQEGMQALLSAGSSIKQAGIHKKVAREMEGRAAVLQSEIKLDAGRKRSTEAKQEELAKVEQTAENAKASQFRSLKDANEAIDKAGESEAEHNRVAGNQDVEKDSKKTDKNAEKDISEKKADPNQKEDVGAEDKMDLQKAKDISAKTQQEQDEYNSRVLLWNYVPIDVRL